MLRGSNASTRRSRVQHFSLLTQRIRPIPFSLLFLSFVLLLSFTVLSLASNLMTRHPLLARACPSH